MPEAKRVLHFPIDDSKQIVPLLKEITKLKADIDVSSTPSSVKISVYGSEDKVKGVSKKIRDIVEETKSVGD